MFVGHFGLAYAVRSAAPGVSLGTLFVATQLSDIVHSALLLADVEQVRVHAVPAGSPTVEIVHAPYSHSALATLVLAAAVFVVLLWTSRRSPVRPRTAGVVAALAASHYLLDLLVHPSGLPILDHGAMIRLGIPSTMSIWLEITLLLGGAWLYLRSTDAQDRIGRYGSPALVIGLAAFGLYVSLSPPPESVTVMAMSQLAAYAALAAVAYWLDRHRTLRGRRARGHRPPSAAAPTVAQ